jgi:hypothetical protein
VIGWAQRLSEPERSTSRRPTLNSECFREQALNEGEGISKRLLLRLGVWHQPPVMNERHYRNR